MERGSRFGESGSPADGGPTFEVSYVISPTANSISYTLFAIVNRFTITPVAKLREGGYPSVYYYASHTLATGSSEEMQSFST